MRRRRKNVLVTHYAAVYESIKIGCTSLRQVKVMTGLPTQVIHDAKLALLKKRMIKSEGYGVTKKYTAIERKYTIRGKVETHGAINS